jgi:hypothetical protein
MGEPVIDNRPIIVLIGEKVTFDGTPNNEITPFGATIYYYHSSLAYLVLVHKM